jgi:hypothetical protein
MATPNNIPVDRVRVFARDGSPLAEFKARVERSWALVDEGRAQFTYPSRISDVVNKKIINYGNWILVENSYLPAWVGVIDPPRTWSGRNVTVSAYTAERVFSWRYGVLEAVKNGSSGSIIVYLLYLVNLAEPTIITAGVIDNGGGQMQETINPTPLSEDLRRVQERSGGEYQFRPVVNDAGRLSVYMDWAYRVGVETSALLHEGKGGGNVEVASSLMVEDGKIINDLVGYNDAMTWQSKVVQKVVNQQSISDYGLRQSSNEYSGATTNYAVWYYATRDLKKNLDPIKKFALNALNVGDTFNYLNVGNVLNLQLQNAGFVGGGLGQEARVRITGMHYDPNNKNKISLTTETKL